QLGCDGEVDLRVFDASGRCVRTLVNGTAKAGNHLTVWDGTDDQGHNLSHGVYFIRLTTPTATAKTKTVLAR
ncbi:MAG: FlgD immunoglobulin-like domain containing protein, partial [candidate division WOR-3 bacterium]